MKLMQTDLFTSFERRGNSPKLGGGKLHLAAFNLHLLTSFNPTASLSLEVNIVHEATHLPLTPGVREGQSFILGSVFA